ncbi:MAG: putative sensor domain DACNV-containing protein [Vicinamibacteraceae bacterium]
MSDGSAVSASIPSVTGQAYAAARTVSPAVHAYFARYHAELQGLGERPAASLPDIPTIEGMIDAAFWASLRREEGYVPRISLAFLAPDDTAHPLRFARPLPLRPQALTRVAPAVERAGIHLGVWPGEHGLYVWGTTHTVPAWCVVLEVAAPGLLVLKHHRGDESGKFVNVAVLEGDQVKVVEEHGWKLPDCPPLVMSMLGLCSAAAWNDSSNLLVPLAVSMRAHGRGGLLLVVPAGTDAWQESIVWPIPYAVAPPFSELMLLNRAAPDEARRQPWQEALDRAVAAVAGLTAVDGATLLTSEYNLLAFGAKITRRKDRAQVSDVMVTEPIQGAAPAIVGPEQLGGTRHLSAAQFVHDQRDSIALVASQDGRFTIFAWSTAASTVHAHRIEMLLL